MNLDKILISGKYYFGHQELGWESFLRRNMRIPVWILNVCLFFILLVVLISIIIVWRRPIVSHVRMKALVVDLPKKDIESITISKIYNNDLFRTYVQPIKTIVQPRLTVDVPPLPKFIALKSEMPPEVKFLEPIKVAVVGVIISTDEKDNRAIIADERTLHERLYSVGDIVEDAEIIRIERKSVIFMRSNGVQEVVFLNAAAAAADPVFNGHTQDLREIVVRKSESEFVIDPKKFTFYVMSLARFIDMLDLTTAFSASHVGLGVRVGALAPRSLGVMLGLEAGDLVTQINESSLDSMESRVSAYNLVRGLSL